MVFLYREFTLSKTFARWLYSDTPSLDSFCRNCLDPSYDDISSTRHALLCKQPASRRMSEAWLTSAASRVWFWSWVGPKLQGRQARSNAAYSLATVSTRIERVDSAGLRVVLEKFPRVKNMCKPI